MTRPMIRPRIGFVGVGWIGRDRMRALAASGEIEPVFVADASPDAAAEAAAEIGASVIESSTLLQDVDVDGVVIATPSALHAEQSIAALDRGVAVFCQKPLGRNAAETRRVVDAARRSGALLAVDLSYRHLNASRVIRADMAEGRIGRVFAADLVFHNAYGPDKAWFRDPVLSGGGCVIDLAVHLVDLLGWLLPDRRWEVTDSRLHTEGVRLEERPDAVEDYAVATLVSDAGTTVTLACSWFLDAGVDAVIGATLYGTDGALRLHNVGGSFYHFEAVLHRGTSREVLVGPPDEWGGRAAVDWAEQLGRTIRDGTAPVDDLDHLIATAALIDGIYRR